jgi:hypothetical protein
VGGSKFENGTASARAQTSTPLITPAAAESAVKLFWEHK